MPAPTATKPETTATTADLTDLTVIPAGGGTPATDPDSEIALDELLKKATEEGEEKKEEEAAAKKQSEDDAAKKKSEDEVAAKKNSEDGLGLPGQDKKAAEEAAAKGEVKKDDFDAVLLPPHTKPKTGEAFETVKTLARSKISAAEKERDELREKLSKAEGAAKGGLPLEAEKELKELRAFRQSMDVEADPSFKQWDSKIAENKAAVTAKLRAAGFTDEHFKQIEKHGGIGEIDWDALGDKIPSNLKKYIENKVFENEDLADKKKVAIEAAKKNSSEFLATRQKETEGGSEQFTKEATAKFEELVPKMEWLVEKTAAKDAKPEDKAAIDAHNKLVKSVRADVTEAIADDSPNMRAILVVGWAQLQKLRVEHEGLKASTTAKITTLEKELADKVAHLEKIKKSSTTRLRDSSAPDGKVSTPGKVDLNEDGASALDRIRAEVTAGKE